MPEVTTIKKRSDFLSAAGSGFKSIKPTVIIQSRIRALEDAASPVEIRIGFTATKKLGNAVVRNRTKRRLRAAVAKLVPEFGIPGCDYVFIGRKEICEAEFSVLSTEIKNSLKHLEKQMAAYRRQK